VPVLDLQALPVLDRARHKAGSAKAVAHIPGSGLSQTAGRQAAECVVPGVQPVCEIRRTH
jgi:hypothetical protein